ncbi:hypothetical protein TWF696_005879 [Orbilia brochopaga]|uniref:Uncharacterized protein n=1 Tax=Orbilia brochopaga TaxID=3140254 RepID=A0AAV9UUL7_9PEZI
MHISYLRPVIFFSLVTTVIAWWQISVNSLLPNIQNSQIKGRPYQREITELRKCYTQPLTRGAGARPIEVEGVIVFNSPPNAPQVQVLMFYQTGPCDLEPYIVVKLNDLPLGLQTISFKSLGIRERPTGFRGYRYTDPEVQPYLAELRGGQNGVWYLNNPSGKYVWLNVVDQAPSTAIDAAVRAGEYHDATVMTSAMLRGYRVYREQIAQQPPRAPISDPFFGDRREGDTFEIMAADFQRALVANQPLAWRQKYNRLNAIATFIFNNWAQVTAGVQGLDTGAPMSVPQIQPQVQEVEEELEESDDERLYKQEPKQELGLKSESDGAISSEIDAEVDDYVKGESEGFYPGGETKEEIRLSDEDEVEEEGNIVPGVKKEEYKVEQEYTDEGEGPYEDEYEEINEYQDEYDVEDDASPTFPPDIVDQFFNTDLNQYTYWTEPPGFDADQVIAEIEELTRLGKAPLPYLDPNANTLVEEVLENVVPRQRLSAADRRARRRTRKPTTRTARPQADENESVAPYDFGEPVNFVIELGPSVEEAVSEGLASPSIEESLSVGEGLGTPARAVSERTDSSGDGLDADSYEPVVGKNLKIN